MSGALPPILSTETERISLASLGRQRMSAPGRHTPEAHEAQRVNVGSVMPPIRTARVPFLIARVRLALYRAGEASSAGVGSTLRVPAGDEAACPGRRTNLHVGGSLDKGSVLMEKGYVWRALTAPQRDTPMT